MNRVQIIGNLGGDPEVRQLRSGGRVVNLRVAINDRSKDAAGDPQTRTEWVPVVIFNETLGDIAVAKLCKGSKVYVEGQFQTRKWTDASQIERYTSEVVLGKFNAKLFALAADDPSAGTYGEPRSTRPTGGGTGAPLDPDDDLPFGPEIR